MDGIGALKQQLEVAQKEAASYKAKLANGGNGASKQPDDTGDIFELGMYIWGVCISQSCMVLGLQRARMS